MWLKRHYLNSSSTLKQQRSPNHHLTGPLSAAWLSCHFLIALSHLLVSENLYWPDFSSVHPSPFPSFTYSACVSQGSILSCHLILYSWISKAKWYTGVTVSSVQSLSHVWLFATSWTEACQASLSITNSRSLLKLMSIKSVMPSNCLILCHPLLFHLQSFPPSGSFQMSQFFTSGGQSTGVSASASVLPMNIQDWFPLGWGNSQGLRKKARMNCTNPTLDPLNWSWEKQQWCDF